MFLSLLLTGAVVAQIRQNSIGDVLNSRLSANHSQFVNLSVFIKWDTVINCIASLLVFFVTVRLLRPLAVSRMISQFFCALEKMFATFYCYAPQFLIIIIASAMLFSLLLSASNGSYQSFPSALMTLINGLLGLPMKKIDCYVEVLQY